MELQEAEVKSCKKKEGNVESCYQSPNLALCLG